MSSSYHFRKNERQFRNVVVKAIDMELVTKHLPCTMDSVVYNVCGL